MLNMALKEWAVVCDLMLQGGLTLMLRKGGILERGGPGVFELEHPRFWLFPSWAHQKPEMLKPEFAGRIERRTGEPMEVPIRGWGEAVKIWRLTAREPLIAGGPLSDLHPWSDAQIDMRFNYKPQNPLYLMAVRVRRLEAARMLTNRDEYAGCKSWVPLRDEDGMETEGASPVLSDEVFTAVTARVTVGLGHS